MSTVRVQETDRQGLVVQGAVINKGLSIGANLEFWVTDPRVWNSGSQLKIQRKNWQSRQRRVLRTRGTGPLQPRRCCRETEVEGVGELRAHQDPKAVCLPVQPQVCAWASVSCQGQDVTVIPGWQGGLEAVLSLLSWGFATWSELRALAHQIRGSQGVRGRSNQTQGEQSYRWKDLEPSDRGEFRIGSFTIPYT